MKKNTKMKIVAVAGALLAGSATFAQEVYEGGRGLITLEGPTGLFINPTSGTLPQGYGTVQYCIFFPNTMDDLFDNPALGHGGIASLALTDELEVGVQGTFIDPDSGDTSSAVGPFARLRLTQDVENGVPEVSIGGYSRLGDDNLQKYGAFLALMKRTQLGDGVLRSAAVHAGVRTTFLEEGEDHTAAYAGLEIEMPLRMYAVGEIQPFTTDDDIVNPQEEVPYAFGLQWRAGGINMSVAGIQNGGTPDISFLLWYRCRHRFLVDGHRSTSVDVENPADSSAGFFLCLLLPRVIEFAHE